MSFLVPSEGATLWSGVSKVDAAISFMSQRFACFQTQHEEFLSEDGAHARSLGHGSDLRLWEQILEGREWMNFLESLIPKR